MRYNLIKDSKEAVEFFENLSSFDKNGSYSVALNAEKLIRMRKDDDFLSLIKAARVHVVDGIGAKIFLRRWYGINSSKVDFPSIVFHYSNQKRLKVGIVGGSQEQARENKEILRLKYPSIKFETVVDGYLTHDTLLCEIGSKNLDFCFLGLGTPLQEYEAHRLSRLFPSTFFICCGGAIDVQVGRKARAPAWLIHSYFEWLYRLIIEPYRIGRYVKLVKILPMLFRTKDEKIDLWDK